MAFRCRYSTHPDGTSRLHASGVRFTRKRRGSKWAILTALWLQYTPPPQALCPGRRPSRLSRTSPSERGAILDHRPGFCAKSAAFRRLQSLRKRAQVHRNSAIYEYSTPACTDKKVKYEDTVQGHIFVWLRFSTWRTLPRFIGCTIHGCSYLCDTYGRQ